ncbi:MAG TPA: argininosuccinate lyase, partial [Synergistaceae bacterium]|nr:argininosuccinate lyase [Synergistaceae bacterium]
RNDQVATALRLYLRGAILGLQDALDDLLSVLLGRAQSHAEVLVPGYTHLQQAQPVALGHYWMAHFWAFLRDDKRFSAAHDAADECPLGSGALAGSTLPLDRTFVARDLGFSRVTDNSMDTVASRDYLLDTLYAAASFGIHASRLAEDLIVYASTEFGWIRLPDAFCTGSSMMPQKKNPDVLELIRGKAGQFVGHLVDLMTTTKGLPLTYNRDLQEDKRGLWGALDTAAAVLDVLPPLLARVEVDEPRAREAFRDGYLLSTDVAEFLVRRGVPFRTAHERTGRAVRWCLERQRPLASLSLKEWQALIPEASEELLPLLTPESAVRRRTTLGGTAPESVQRQILQGQEVLAHRRMKRERRWNTLPRELSRRGDRPRES